MESLHSEIKIVVPEKSKMTNERQYAVKKFVDELNKGVGEKYKKGEKWFKVKPVNATWIAVKLSHLNVEELYAYFSMCKSSRSGFSKCFYGALKPIVIHR